MAIKAWFYSATTVGKLRATCSITDDVMNVVNNQAVSADSLEDEARQALVTLDECATDHTALLSLIKLASLSDSWQAITEEDWHSGIHVVITDYALPGGYVMFTRFTFPYEQPLAEDELKRLIANVTSDDSSCCK